ncbi:MAG: histidine kinase [Eubacteriales bacterium]|nr:histidine kinase [Eubacteriales bacterium]
MRSNRGPQNGKIYWKKSIRTSQLLVFTLFLILNVIFSGVLYYMATSYVKKSVSDKMNAQASFYLETLDNQMENTQNILFNMFSDRKLVFLVYPMNLLDDYEMRDAYLSEQERILMLKNNNPLIEEGIIFLPNVEMYISDRTIAEMTEEDFAILDERSKIINEGVCLQDGGLYMVSAGEPYYAVKDRPDALFVLKFDEEKIRKTLTTFNTIDGSGSFLYNLEEEIYIGSKEEDTLGRAILEQIESELPEDESAFHKEDFSSVVELKDGRYQIFLARSGYFGYFVQYVPEKEVLKDISPYKWLIVLYIIGVGAAAVFFSKSTERFVHKPLNRLVEAFSKAEREGLDYEGTQDYGENEFSYLFERFDRMQERQKALTGELVEQKNLAQKAELKQLQAQINPHFLYNSFLSLRNKIRREDLEAAEELAGHLSAYFRFITRNDESNVSLKDEVAHARSYTSIQQMRFYNRIRVVFPELPGEYEEIEVPRLILQPVIENALQHGLEDKEENGILEISFCRSETGLEIHVEDNGEKLTDETIAELRRKLEYRTQVTGLVNIHQRLKLFFGENGGLRIGRSRYGGAEVTICIPVKD